MIEQKIQKITEKYNSFENELHHLIGQQQILTQQIETSQVKIAALEEIQKLDERAIEVLNLVQKSTRDKIKEAFENLVTFALHSIYQRDYQFRLEFSTRGNVGELDFTVKSPENIGFLSLKECTAGGSLDIISVALRCVLIQVLRPKVEGFIMWDEPCKMLRGEQQLNNLFNFFTEMSKKLNRQFIIIPPTDNTAFFVDKAETRIKIGK